MADEPARGLADVVAATTALSDVDGRAGRLFCRGYDVRDPAGRATFEYSTEGGLPWIRLAGR